VVHFPAGLEKIKSPLPDPQEETSFQPNKINRRRQTFPPGDMKATWGTTLRDFAENRQVRLYETRQPPRYWSASVILSFNGILREQCLEEGGKPLLTIKYKLSGLTPPP